MSEDVEGSTSKLDEKMYGLENEMSIPKFMRLTLIVLGLILGHFLAGTIILYGCRLSQSALIPNHMGYYPYTNVTCGDIHDKGDGEFWTNIFSDGEVGHRIKFEREGYEIIPSLVNSRDTLTTKIGVYFINIMLSLVNFSFSTVDSTLSVVNKYFSENAMIVLAPLILLVLSIVLLIGNGFYFCYSWFAEMSILFKTGGGTVKRKEWQDISMALAPWDYGLSAVLAFFAFIAFLVILFVPTPNITAIASIFMPLTLLSIMSFKAQYYNGVSIENVNFFKIYKLVLKYYKSIVLVMMGYGVAFTAMTHLGIGVGAGFAGIVNLIIVLEFFNVLNTFKSEQLPDPREIVDYEPIFPTPCTNSPILPEESGKSLMSMFF